MPLSSLPEVGFTLPAGATNVKVKSTAANPTDSKNKLDITTLEDAERVYADAPLVDAGTAADEGITQEVSVTFFGEAPAVNTNPEATGWLCVDSETEYAVGEMIKGTATYRYKPAPPE
jgi:hypothetical protein